jgi:hypothetical protein
MKWSKTKKALEALLADAVTDHVQFHMTRYGPGLSSIMERAWITWDKRELVNMSSIAWLTATHTRARQLRGAAGATDYGDPEQRDGYLQASADADVQVARQGLLSRYQFVEAVDTYLSLPIAEALAADDPIIKAIAMFDRRVGRRRLQQLRLTSADHPLVRECYTLRCEAEGITNTGVVSTRGAEPCG